MCSGKCPHGVKLKSGLFGTGKETKCPKCEHELSLKIKLADLDMKMKEQKHAMELKEKELQLRKTYNTEFSLDMESVNGRPPPRRLNTLTMEEVVVLLHCMKMPIDDRVIYDNLIDGNMLSVVEKMEDLTDMGIHLSTLKCKVLFYNVMTFKTEGVAQHYLKLSEEDAAAAALNNPNRLSLNTTGALTEAAINSHLAESLHSRPLLSGGFLSATASTTPLVTPRLDCPPSFDSFSAPSAGGAGSTSAFSPGGKESRSLSPAPGSPSTGFSGTPASVTAAAPQLLTSSGSASNLLKTALVQQATSSDRTSPTSSVPAALPSHPVGQTAAQRELLRENSTASVTSESVPSPAPTIAAPVRPPLSPGQIRVPPHLGVATAPSTTQDLDIGRSSSSAVKEMKVSPAVPRLAKQTSKDTASIEGPPKRQMPERRKSENCVSLNNTPRIPLVAEPQLLKRAESLRRVPASAEASAAAAPLNLLTTLGTAISGIFTDVSFPAVIEITSSASVIEALKILIATPTDELFWETVRNTLKDIFSLINNNKDSLKAVVKLNAVQLTADVMYLYKKHLEIVKSAVAILQLMSSEVAYQKLFGQTMMSELLIECLDAYNTTPEIVTGICAIFKNITANENHNNIILLDGGGVCILLVDLLTQYKNNAAMCIDILNAIRNISIYEHSTKFLGKLGICELVVEVLRLHKTNGNIVSAVCKVVKHIAVDEGNELMLGSEGIAEVYVDILKMYKNHEIVTAKVCGAIVDVSFSAVNQVRFGAAGVCEMLVNVLKRYQNKEVIVEIACGSMKNISVCNENEKQFGRVGACEVLTDLLRIHGQSELLVTAICAAIKNITFDDENRVRFGAAGACELLLELAKIHKNNERIRAAVKNLRANADNKKRFQRLGLV